MAWKEELAELNEKLRGLDLLRIEDGNELDLVFGNNLTGEEIFRLSLFYAAGYVGHTLTDLR